jgi:hypothetical protein
MIFINVCYIFEIFFREGCFGAITADKSINMKYFSTAFKNLYYRGVSKLGITKRPTFLG